MTEASMIAVLCFALPFIHVKTDVQSGTCRYRCGSVVQSDCYCDDLCWLYKDCCPDFYQECRGVALYPQPVTLKNLFTYWKTSILIQSSQCTRTMNGDYWVVSKCSLNPEIQLKFKESLYNIKQMKTKDSFLNYVSSFTLQDVVKGCEKLLTFKYRQTGIFIHFLFSDFQMEKHFTFANVFCALCNGFILTPNDKNLKCLSEVSYDVSIMSFSTLAEYLTEIKCEFFQDSLIMRTCSLLNVESRISPEKKNTNDSLISVSNSVTQLSRQNLTLDALKNLFGSYIYQTNSSESTNTKVIDDSKNELYFSSKSLLKNTLNELKHIDINGNNKNVSRDKKSCNRNEAYCHWIGQCVNVFCPEGFVHYVGKCFKYIICNYSLTPSNRCFAWRETVKGKFIPISKLFRDPGFPKMYVKATFEFSDPLQSVMNLSLEDFILYPNDPKMNTIMTNETLSPNKVLTFLKLNLVSKSQMTHLKNVMHDFDKYISANSNLKTQNNVDDVAKITESITCFRCNNQRNYQRHSPSSSVDNQYLNDTHKLIGLRISCDHFLTKQTNLFEAELKTNDKCLYYVIKALAAENLMIAMIKIMRTIFQFFVNHTEDIVKKIFLTFSNNMFGVSKLVNLSTQTRDFKIVNGSYSNITCPEGRTLTFSQVDVPHVQDDVTLKIYLNPEELPIDNVWFELSMSVDIYEPVIETCILSLCVLPGDTSIFCPHSTFLKIPYSQVVFYKSLLLVSEDISQVEEFLRENKHTFQSPKNFLDLLKSSLSNVLVYSMTSFIKTNSGVVLCVDPSNIYKDDTRFILNHYQNSIDQICSSILLLKFGVLLQILRDT
uniref:SMB domain-containing protein n=1 Tax=Biomphalaria glabrata TaxID=6526 RepID=A0A2C9M9C2_BIOGL